MPNWCRNDLTLQISDVQKGVDFENFLKGLDEAAEKGETPKAGIFTYFLPMPEEAEEGWYSWRLENWGTKWDVTECHWERDGDTFWLAFDTAWGPPTSLYEAIYERDDGWEITALYEEPGMQFVGKFEDGFDETYEYDFENEDWKDEIPEELVEFAGLEYEYEYHLENLNEEDEDF